jgi:DNA-binding CsgD family transcriptional regulator
MIEAAYRTDLTAEQWLTELASISMRHWRAEAGALAAQASTYQITEADAVVFDASIMVGGSPEYHEFSKAIPPSLPPDYVRQTFACLPTAMALASGDAATRARTQEMFANIHGARGVRDLFIVNGLDPTRHGIYLNASVAEDVTLSRRQVATWTRVAAHLAAGYRLRRMPQPAEGEAVITPSGRVEHAQEPAKSPLARRQLAEAAIAIDRARTKRQRADDFTATEMWHALVAGRWTLVDWVDRDGRRFYIARQNDPHMAKHHALSMRERQVIGYAVLGHSNKLIAYELGVSPSTVANHLATAAAKLGIRSRAALVQAAASLGVGRGAPR